MNILPFNYVDVFIVTTVLTLVLVMIQKCKSMAQERDTWRHEALEISKELKDTKEMVRRLRRAVRNLQ